MNRTTIALISALSAVALAASACEKQTASAPAPENAPARSDTHATTERNAAKPAPSTPPTNPPADNTGINTRDRAGATPTPMDQAENEADRAITQAIRRAIMDDKSLSVTAQNIKIITAAGVVTLRGPVNSEAEKTVIGDKARAAVGVVSVDNQLEVKLN